MPHKMMHEIFTLRRYGVTGSEIHIWMDKPSKIYGKDHRIFRHDYSMWIPQEFVDQYGLELAQAIVRSHIWLDKNWHC